MLRSDRGEIIRQCKMIVIGLARESEAGEHFGRGGIDRLRVVDDQIIAIGLAGEQAVHSLRFEPAFAESLAAHLFQARVELLLQFLPFRAVGVLGAPRETVQFVEVEMLEAPFPAAFP